MHENKLHCIQYLIDLFLKGRLNVDALRLLLIINNITYCTDLKEIDKIIGYIPVKGKR